MKGIEKITGRIIEEAEAEAAVVIKEAEQKAAEILAGYKEVAHKEYEDRYAEGMAEAVANADQINRNARLSAKKAVLSVKHVLVKEAYASAHKEILALPEEEYLKLLTDYAVKSAVSGTEKMQLNEKDLKGIGEKLVKMVNARLEAEGRTGKLTLDEKPINIDGGLLLTENDISANCSVDVLVNSLCEKLDRSVAGILFG